MDTNAFASPTGSQASPAAQTTNPLALQQQVSTYPAAISNMIKAIMQGNNDYQNQQKKLMGNQQAGGQPPGQPMSLSPPQDPTNPTGTGTSGPPVGFAPPMSPAAMAPPVTAPSSATPGSGAGAAQQAPAMPVPDQNGGLGSQNAPMPPTMMDPMSATMMQGSPSSMAGVDPMTAALMQGNIPSATPGF